MRRSFENSIVIAATRERVWWALTDPAELNRWETTDAHLDLRPHGGFLYEYAYGPSRPGTFLVVDPPGRLMQDNLVFHHNASYHYINTNTLETVPDGTRLTVKVEGYGDHDEEQWLLESMDLGWETDLRILKAFVEWGKDLRPQLWRGLKIGLQYISHSDGGTQGIRVLEALEGGPAATAGITSGDIVVALDGEPFADFRGFRSLLARYQPGDTAIFRVLQGGEGTATDLKVVFGDAR
ncbi:SRPBCC domain-containing protein [Actinomadura sp. 3N407]|uniref:SRPBCC family protein n=1 Tax=Actinomadura sp. 3N407 TaxID=3457423 RepID=UPI003FCC6665